MKSQEVRKIAKQIRELDTAVGMLMVAAMKDDTVKTAMQKVSSVSFELGQLTEVSG